MTEVVTRAELESRLADLPPAPADGVGADATPRLALVVENVGYNRYTLQAADDAGAGASPAGLEGLQIEAVNVAEPYDQDGAIAAGTVVLAWPSQGLWLFAQAVASGGQTGDAASYWAKIVSGTGPAYTVRRQTPSGATTFANAGGSADVTAYNTWELTVDAGATADVPAGAVVRVFEEQDTGDPPTTRRFFTYPLHAVYR
ncbi:MAG: hypothetical protein BIFFINMI_02914 [Phycisphaerae bacterium]|nr:hypothetical protein [Phycisphaerae bacterium]